MSRTITQKVIFKNATCKSLYQLYVNARLHAAATGGGKARINAKPGATWSAHNGYCFGKNLLLVKDQLIVQSWRASDWSKSDADSTFLIYLKKKGKDTVLHCIHANVPDNQASALYEGWYEFYWEPWKEFLSQKKK